MCVAFYVPVNMTLAPFLLIIGLIFCFTVVFKFNRINEKVCTKCGFKSAADFCPKCGSSMQIVSQVQSQEKVCSKCGQQLKGEAFCPGCGTKTN
jgi:RNA polymerase subunit RPABC4/transcription elongation factor Spt4